MLREKRKNESVFQEFRPSLYRHCSRQLENPEPSVTPTTLD
ncbi:rCG49749 [Rattus norvegicus]|uniref:RCG49749 n=1 Tax=Rattus norvegicus TaxID=10116 RepID=A6K4H6_RAT|nr:rCG49749 [Rattus norvegicus]